MASLVEEEYEAFTREGLWKRVFDRIQNEAAVLYSYTSKHARSPENRERNRYRDVSPYDDFRVKLEGCENNYINASRVQVPLAGRTYILTQGPLASTSGHFWLMVWQQNSLGVLMLNRVIEDGRLKCHPYFPTGAEYNGDDSQTYDDVGLRVEYVKTDDHSFFVIRTLRLINLQTDESKLVLQFHYIDWPDFGIPKNSQTFLSFLDAVRQSGVLPLCGSKEEQPGPPVIHCSAGIGRSGTFCLVDSALVQVEKTRSLLSLDLRSLLIDMRQYRAGLIQRPEQLKFSYMAILDGAHAILASPPPSPLDDEEEMKASDDSEGSEAISYDSDLTDEEAEVVDPLVEINTSTPDDGPAPPIRTSSLAADQAIVPEPQADKSEPPPKPSRVPQVSPETDFHIVPQNPGDSSAGDMVDNSPLAPEPTKDNLPPKVMEHTSNLASENTEANIHVSQTNSDIPEPPTRTTSLQKSASLDEHPPPVPPRPPSSFDRQVSAPVPKTTSADKKPNNSFEEEEEYGYGNADPKPIGMLNNAMKKKREIREEKNRKTRELVDAMKAKQMAAEAAKNSSHIFTHWGFMVGAGITLAIAAGLMYFRPSMFL